VHTEKDAAGMMGLSLLMELFDAIDEDILLCWNARCNVSTGSGKCHILTRAKALSIYQNLVRVSDTTRYNGKNNDHDYFDLSDSDVDSAQNRYENKGRQNELRELNETIILRDSLSETQCADILLTQKWVQDRLWNLCFSHGLLHLHPGPDHELGFGYAFENAQSALRLCRSLRISAIEAHGVGIVSLP
jgi:hypothetical protein